MSNYDKIIYDVARRNGFNDTTSKLIVAQARFESSDYGSNVFRNNMNTSGMKFIGQPLATRGTLAPYNERSSQCQQGGTCKNNDYYAKFKSVEDSARDKIERLFAITRNGVTPDDLKKSQSAQEFSTLQKKRNYYGFHAWDTPQGQAEIDAYARGLLAKLRKINIIEFVKENPKSTALAGILIFGLIGYSIFYYKNVYKKI
jgi:hypothetical protein